VNPPSQSIDAVVVHQRALVLDDTGELVEKPVPVYFLSSQVLGALIVFEDMGFIHHELVLIEHRLKAIDASPVLLRGGAPGVLDLDERGRFLEHGLRERVEHTVANVRLNQEATYFIVLGAVCERHDECCALGASKARIIQ
jgi:hypothetical protein